MENKDIKSEELERVNKFKREYELFKSSKKSYQNKLQILNEFFTQYITILESLPEGYKKQFIVKKCAAFISDFTLKDTDSIEKYNEEDYTKILSDLYDGVFRELLTYDLDADTKEFITKIMNAINPETEGTVEDFMKDVEESKEDVVDKKDENDSELIKEYIKKNITRETNVDDKVFYYLKLSPRITNNYEFQKELYFKKDYPRTEIKELNRCLNDHSFKDALDKKIGFLLTENSISGSQRYTLEDGLKINFSTSPKDVNSIDDILFDDEFEKFFSPSNPYDKNPYNKEYLINAIYSALSKNGLYLQMQKKNDGIVKTFLSNTQNSNFIASNDLKNEGESEIIKLNKKLTDIVIGNKKIAAPPILYNYTVLNTAEIENNIESEKKLLEYHISQKRIVNKVLQNMDDTYDDVNISKSLQIYLSLMTEKFVKNNYKFSNGIGILKQDIALYEKTYDNFNIDEFTAKIVESLTDKEKKISDLITQRTTTSYAEYLWSWIEFISLTKSDYENFYNYNYGYKFDYFDSLTLKGDLNLWYKKGEPRKPVEKISDIPSQLNSIIPLSVLYNNVNNRIIQRNPDGTFEITYNFKNVHKSNT